MLVHIEHEARFRSGRRPRGAAAAGGPAAEPPPADDAAGWLAGRLPDGWFTGPADITVDRDEILVVGPLPAPEGVAGDAAAAGRIARFREDTRCERMAVARETQERFGRTVSWGARVGDVTELFTTASVPVMTRLRQPERRVLDTLVESGVARSRSDALAWCVRLVGRNQDEWIAGLREALTAVEAARARGPEV